MTIERLQALLAEWKRTLRLMDWDVDVKLRRIFDMHRTDVTGEVSWVLQKKSALIGVLDPQDYDPSIIRPYDPEQTLVHELVHLHFAPFAPIGEETYQHEQAIDAIAHALVEAKRKEACESSKPTEPVVLSKPDEPTKPEPKAGFDFKFKVGDRVRIANTNDEYRGRLRGVVSTIQSWGDPIHVRWDRSDWSQGYKEFELVLADD